MILSFEFTKSSILSLKWWSKLVPIRGRCFCAYTLILLLSKANIRSNTMHIVYTCTQSNRLIFYELIALLHWFRKKLYECFFFGFIFIIAEMNMNIDELWFVIHVCRMSIDECFHYWASLDQYHTKMAMLGVKCYQC